MVSKLNSKVKCWKIIVVVILCVLRGIFGIMCTLSLSSAEWFVLRHRNENGSFHERYAVVVPGECRGQRFRWRGLHVGKLVTERDYHGRVQRDSTNFDSELDIMVVLDPIVLRAETDGMELRAHGAGAALEESMDEPVLSGRRWRCVGGAATEQWWVTSNRRRFLYVAAGSFPSHARAGPCEMRPWRRPLPLLSETFYHTHVHSNSSLHRNNTANKLSRN